MRQANIIFLLAGTVLISSVSIAAAQSENPYLKRQQELARQRFKKNHPEAPNYHAASPRATSSGKFFQERNVRSVSPAKTTKAAVSRPEYTKPIQPAATIEAPKATSRPQEIISPSMQAAGQRKAPAEQMLEDAPIGQNNSPNIYNNLDVQKEAQKPAEFDAPPPNKNLPLNNNANNNANNNGGINPAAYKTVAPKPSPRRDNSLRISTGGRRDNLDWNIASDASGTATPNILSELKWRKLNIMQVQAEAAGSIPKDADYIGGIHGEASAYTGVILAGDNQDSDYFGNNRTDEFSRSNNDAGKGHVRGFSSGLGYEFDTDVMHASVPNLHSSIIPLVGYSWQRLYLHMQDGKQTIASEDTPPLGEFAGLNSNYRATWHGPFLGVKLKADYFPHNFGLRTQYSFAKYNGAADWNLRGDFMHPKSFAHQADGRGTLFQLDYSYALSDNTEIFALASRQAWVTDAGTDTVYFADETTVTNRLNKVNWNSQNYLMGVAAHW